MTIRLSSFPGADPTGTTICTAAVQAFLTAARKQEGIIDAGTYLVDDTLVYGYDPRTEPAPGGIPGNRPLLAGVLRGEGIGASTLKWGGPLSPKPVLVVSSPLCRIEDFTIDGGGKKAQHCIVFHHASGATCRIYALHAASHGIRIDGKWYSATDTSMYGFNEDLRLSGRSYNNGGSGLFCDWNCGADNSAMIIDGFAVSGNVSHGFEYCGFLTRFRDCRAEGNQGYGYFIGKSGQPYSLENLIDHPGCEGNSLGGFRFERAVRNVLRTVDTFADISEDNDCANLSLVATNAGIRVRGDQDLVLSSGKGVTPGIAAKGSGATQQPVNMSGIKLTPLQLPAHTVEGGTLTIDVSKAARFVVTLKANVGNLVFAIPAGASVTNVEIVVDFQQSAGAGGAFGWHVAKWSATRIGSAGTPVPVLMRWQGGAPPVVGSVAKGSAHDLVRLLYTGEWLEEARSLGVSL